MILIKKIGDLQEKLFIHESSGESVGFVPTMGALHQGHLHLVAAARKHHPVTVCSIFVNPTQFNSPADFEKYPSTLERDIDQLEDAGCSVLFLPSVSEMYPPNDPIIHYNLGFIETILEGKHRPGHFQGVSRIVDKLLAAVKPDSIYIGQKDYQQCMVIKKVIELKGYRSRLQVCPTVRDEGGLAMSSRNLRLDEAQQLKAREIFKKLQFIASSMKPGELATLKKSAADALTRAGFKVDYVEIANTDTLELIANWDGQTPVVALIAAALNHVRLIDNLVIKHPG